MIEGFHAETAEVAGTRLHFWRGGEPNGQPVLLWHGFLGTGYSWRYVAPALARQGLSVLVPDMRGFGDSDKPEGAIGYDARALAEEFRGLVAQIGFGRDHPLLLVAHDLGAWAALLWAADHPEEVAGLVYIDSPVMLSERIRPSMAYAPEAMGRMPLWWWILPLAPGVPERLVVGNERAFLTYFYERANRTTSVFTDAVITEYLRTFTGREGVLGAMGMYRAAFETMAQTDALTVSKVRQPVIGLMSKGRTGELEAALPLVAEDWRVVGVTDCGHFVPEEKPEAVIAAIGDLLRAGSAGG